MKVFLSGAIEGLGDEANEWRKEATEKLWAHGYEVVTPFITNEDKIFHEPNEIVRRNSHLQEGCDLLLVEYMIPDRCYIGTDYELVKALDWNQPVIVFSHEMYRKRVYLRYLATAILPTLEDAIDYIAAWYPPRY